MRLFVPLLSLFVACTPAPAPPQGPAPRPAAPSATAAVDPAPAPASTSVAPSARPPAQLPVLDSVTFRRVLEVPIHSVAFAPSGRVAALGAEVWLGEPGALKQLPAPGPTLTDVHVYFGRDDQPRLMGSDGEQSVYYRWRGGRWQRAASEIGRLGGGKAAPLFGVLGNDDPEVVCKVGDACIIKRRSGWQTIDPPEGRPSVTLQRGTAWALYPASLLRLDKGGFRAFGAALPFSHATGTSATSDSDVWVVEGDAVHRFDGNSWTRTVAPVAGLAGVWAAGPSDVWVVGCGGRRAFRRTGVGAGEGAGGCPQPGRGPERRRRVARRQSGVVARRARAGPTKMICGCERARGSARGHPPALPAARRSLL